MEKDDKLTVPYVVYEGAQVRHERVFKRLIICLMVAVALLFISNAVWLYCWMQFEYVDLDDAVSVEARDGIANFIGENGVITNGSDSGKAKSQGGD